MSVVARFSVHSVIRMKSSVAKVDAEGVPVKDERGYYVQVPGEIRTVKLAPVYSNNDPTHPNSKFWAASPSGQIEIGCANLAAADYFELGEEYEVVFRKIPKNV